MANCVNCGAPLREGAKFCGKCGTKVEEAAFCTECGAKLFPGEAFCTACGTPVDGAAPVPKKRGRPPKEKTARAEAGYLRSVSPEEAAGIRNVSGFYARSDVRVSVSNRAAVYVKGCYFGRVDREFHGLERYAPDILDIAQTPDGILALSFDFHGHMSLARYDDGLKLLSEQEIFSFAYSEDDYWLCGRITPHHAFCIVKKKAQGKPYLVFKYDIASGKLEQRKISGLEVDGNVYADEETLYVYAKGDKPRKDSDGEAEDDLFFAALDTATWRLKRLWNIGGGFDNVPKSYPFYCDFEKGVAWTAPTEAEQAQHDWNYYTLVARALAPEGKPLPQYPVWTRANHEYFTTFEYFDGSFRYGTDKYWIMNAVGSDGTVHPWKCGLHGETQYSFIWNGKIFTDLGNTVNNIYYAYPLSAGEIDSKTDGIKVERKFIED